jgi:hypothetical protein
MGLGSIQVRYDSQRTDEGAFLLLRGHRAPAAGMGTVAEALGGWYRTAVREPRLAAYAARVRDRLACDGGVLADRTVTAAEAARYPDPVMVEGAVITSGVGRMDDQQHALSGVLAARDALARPPARPLPRRHPAPESWLLVVAVALAAWNPVRAGRATAAVARRWVVLGAAGVAVLVAVVTALGGPVLDALSVSDGSALIAAGVATVLSALVALGPWALRPEPAGGSWHDALVPVAVPVLVRADLVALAIACGAGGRGWPYVGGLVLAAALTALASRWRPAPGGTGDRVQRWAARGVAIAAVALGIGVIVEGAFTI